MLETEHGKRAGRDDVLLNSVEHALNVQIHHLGEHLLRVSIELLSPRRTSIGKQNINMIGRLAHLGSKPIQLLDARAVSRHGDGSRAGPLIR